MSKDDFKTLMMDQYNLEIDLEALGMGKGDSITRAELESLLLDLPIKG